MSSENLLKLVLQNKRFTQKDLAQKLKVSPAQISKWKAGEYMSFDMENKMTSLAKIGERNPDVVYWTGGSEQADKWTRLITYLAADVSDYSECSYVSYPLEDEEDTLTWKVLHTLIESGANIPKVFPNDIDFDYDLEHEGNEELFDTLYYGNIYSSLIYECLKVLAKLYDFYAAYFNDLMNDDDLDLYSTDACNIESCLFVLALAKVGKESEILCNFNTFRYETIKEYKKWVETVKHKAISNRVPLKAELMHLVSDEPESLVHEAEAEALGFNDSRLHPDIYMDEILKSMRLLHQVLPAICTKLGITEEELKINESEFWL